MKYSLVVLPCRDMEEELYCNKMVVLALLYRDMEELYCNKMVVLVLTQKGCGGGALLQQDGGAGPHPEGTWRRSSTVTRWWCWSSPGRDVEGGTLLQQDDGTVIPQHGQGGVTRG